MLNDRQPHEDCLSLNRIAGTEQEEQEQEEQHDVRDTFSSGSDNARSILYVLQALPEKEIQTRST